MIPTAQAWRQLDTETGDVQKLLRAVGTLEALRAAYTVQRLWDELVEATTRADTAEEQAAKYFEQVLELEEMVEHYKAVAAHAR